MQVLTKYVRVFQEAQVMLSEKKDDSVQIPMESTKPTPTPKAHDPR